MIIIVIILQIIKTRLINIKAMVVVILLLFNYTVIITIFILKIMMLFVIL